jgi:hypothetical protein
LKNSCGDLPREKFTACAPGTKAGEELAFSFQLLASGGDEWILAVIMGCPARQGGCIHIHFVNPESRKPEAESQPPLR